MGSPADREREERNAELAYARERADNTWAQLEELRWRIRKLANRVAKFPGRVAKALADELRRATW